jgi:DNA modification methylase
VVIFAKPEFRLKSKGDSGCGDVWDIPAAMRIDGHPAPFPVELPRRAIETVGPRLVYEPYSGSGTTLCASEQCGVPCFGVELSAAYVAVALERLSEMGLSPNLQNGG